MKFLSRKRHRPLKRVAALITLAGIFFFGAAAGLFTSAWLDNNPRYTDVAKSAVADLGIDMPASSTTALKTGPQQEKEAPGTAKEVAPRLLPMPLPRFEEDEDFPAPVPPPVNEARSSTRSTTESSGVSNTTQSKAEAALASTTASDETAKSPQTPELQAEKPPVMEAQPSPAEPPKAEVPSVAAAVPVVPKATVPAIPSKSKRPVVQRKPPPSEAEKNHEIERIKRQAGEELRKPGINDGAAKATGSRQTIKKAAMRRPDHSNMLAQCEQVRNLLRRERCKWDICGGKWGKGGCPSYDPPTSMF